MELIFNVISYSLQTNVARILKKVEAVQVGGHMSDIKT